MKVNRLTKIAVFVSSVLCLSWFFAGCRALHTNVEQGVLLLLVGTLGIILTVGAQGFWIYMEEKQAGKLKRTFSFFEKIEQYLERRHSTNGHVVGRNGR